jgi:serine/threonine protein kinase/Flp pilus assembly protein TadD
MRPARSHKTLHAISPLPQQISGYRLIRRRGRGGVAEVWEAESPAGLRVALKLVPLSTDLRAGELRALKITRSIRHPNLLVMFGTWQVENLLVISMELADRSLWDRFLEVIREGLRGIPRSELLGYLEPVAEAIDYLNDYRHSVAGRHGVGIQHRDLKPQNILLFGTCAKVADFGLARLMEQNIVSHTGPCTLPYAAPEYFSGRTARQSDQYALAVTYCQLRGGRMPFPGTSAEITVGHLCSDPDLDGLPEPERPIVARALAKQPEQRWPDCRSFIAALKALDTTAGVAIPDSLPQDQPSGPPARAAGKAWGAFTDLTFPTPHSDFSPVDSDSSAADLPLGDFASTGHGADWRPPVVRLGVSSATLVGELDSEIDRGPGPLRTPAIAPGAGGEAGPPAFAADLGSGWARLGPIAALLAIGLVLSAIGIRSRADRAHARAHPVGALAARFGPRASTTEARALAPESGRCAERTGMAPVLSWHAPKNPIPTTPEEPILAAPLMPSSESEEPNAAMAELVEEATHEPQPDQPISTPWGPTSEKPAVAAQSPALPDSSRTSAQSEPPLPEPPASRAPVPCIDLPSEVTVQAGQETKLRVRVPRNDRSQPVALDFQGLPHGVSVKNPRISAGSEATDVVLSVSAKAPQGLSRVAVAFRTGAERGDAALKLNVLPPSPATVAYERGREELNRGAYSRAVAAFTEAIARKPDSFEAHFYRGVAHYLKGSHREALADYTTAIQLQPGNADIYLLRARVLIDLGQKRQALEDDTEAIRRRPDAKAYLARGSLHHELGSYDRALADYDVALRLQPDNPEILYRRGLTRYYSGDNTGAIADFTEVIRLDPKHAGAYRYRGDAHARLGQNARAAADHDRFEDLTSPPSQKVLR